MSPVEVKAPDFLTFTDYVRKGRDRVNACAQVKHLRGVRLSTPKESRP